MITSEAEASAEARALADLPRACVPRRIHRERLVLFGWGRAIAMQFAHPLIAAA